jgi:outer membrane receptor protein involved in Fe transport
MRTRIAGHLGRATLAGLLLATPALAQRAPAAPDTLPSYRLEGIVVTSRRTPELRSSIPQKVEVVTRADLDRTVGSDVTEVLKKDAGLDVIQYPGLLSGVSVRGFRPQFSGINPHTLVLLDGRPAGATNLATIDVGMVERIEVLKGPASALYGSSAMGGVVNIITRRSDGALHGRARGGYGSFESYRGQANLGGELGGGLDFDLSLAAAGRGTGYRTGGHRLLGHESLTKTLASGGTVTVPDFTRDTTLAFTEYSTRSGSLRAGYELGAGWRANARGGFFQGDHVQSPGDLNTPFPFPTLNDLSRYTGEAGVAGAVGRQDVSVRAYLSHETTAYYDDATDPTFINYRQPIRWYGVQAQDVVRLGAHSLTAGVDYSAAEQRSENFSAPDTPAAPYSPDAGIYSLAAFAEAKLSLLDERLVATLGGRLDRVDFSVKPTDLLPGSVPGSRADMVFNPSAGLLYRLGGGARLHGSAGRAFVTPESFNVAGYSEQRLTPGSVSVARGNPELRPEHSVSWDAGLGLLRERAGIELDLTYFHTDVRDRISPRTAAAPAGTLGMGGDTVASVTTYINADRAEIRGIEGRASYDLGAALARSYSLRLFANATRFLRAREITGETETDIRNVADLTAVVGAEYDDMKRLSARLSGRYVGERLDTDFSDFSNVGDLRYPSFLVLDASTSLRLGDRYRLGLAVGNLTDESYYEVRGYNLPGRNLMVQMGVGF